MPNKVLIIDEDEDIRDALECYFSLINYETTCQKSAATIPEGSHQRPNVILLDHNLRFNGLVACQHLKAQEWTRDIPVIIMSAQSGLSQKALSAGANAYIEKPFDVYKLQQIIICHTKA